MSEEPQTSARVRCFYEVLSIPMDADASMIKKAHRKLALKWHPDKNQDNLEEANNEFRLIQQAYECLSDPTERSWYDEHRESILKGWSAQNDGLTNAKDMIFDVDDFQDHSCFTTFDDNDEDNFFQVYTHVFSKIAEGEISACPNIPLGELESMFPTNFGNSASDYKTIVSPFYAAWDNFSTKLTFAWEDKYDTRDAEHRRIRKAMEGENRKYRKTARKERNEDVLNLVNFVKKMDPRVKAYKEHLIIEKKQKLELEKQEAERKKLENKLAKERWIEERQKEIQEREREMLEDSNNRIRFMFRLADEEDDYGNKKKGKKRNKKKKKGKKGRWGNSDDEQDSKESIVKSKVDQNPTENEDDPAIVTEEDKEEGSEGKNVDNDGIEQNINMDDPQSPDDDIDIDVDMIDYTSEEEEDEEEPEVWKCDICRKEFKSEKQLENHLKSKKHKEAVKKHQKKLKAQQKKEMEAKRLEDEAMEDLLNEFEDM